jgi:hypothetical protein
VSQSLPVKDEVLALSDRIIDVEVPLADQILVKMQALDVKQHPSKRLERKRLVQHPRDRIGKRRLLARRVRLGVEQLAELAQGLLGRVELVDVLE